jgi:hypothetical protein
LKEGLALEAGGEDGLEEPAGVFLPWSVPTGGAAGSTYVVLLDDLLETRVVELRELGEVVHIRDDVAQILLQQVKVLLDRVVSLTLGLLLRAGDGIPNLLLRRCYAPDDLLALDALEGVDLIELLLELLNEALFRLLVPDVVYAERILKALVVNVIKYPLPVERLLELLAESVRAR